MIAFLQSDGKITLNPSSLSLLSLLSALHLFCFSHFLGLTVKVNITSFCPPHPKPMRLSDILFMCLTTYAASDTRKLIFMKPCILFT